MIRVNSEILRDMTANHKAIVPNDDTFRFYFYFMQERMNMFWRKVDRAAGYKNWTEDPILRTYKFTNVYRATDRVSQYLIRRVIYDNLESLSAEDVLLRILVFKIFNKIETWEYLEKVLPEPITIRSFDAHKISLLLSRRQQQVPIFNNAYMMAGSHRLYNDLPSKHEKWLTMVQKEFIDARLFERILEADGLETVYDLLRNCSFLGGFLAYQYAIDFNYSPDLNFSEDSFVKAGIGAIRGIRKCFQSYGHTYEDAIIYVYEHMEQLRERYGYTNFRPLPGHEPTLIDLQNCFCETDKYLRAKIPDLKIGNIRIKQKYRESDKPIQFYFPAKWGIQMTELCTKPNTKELMLF